MRIFAVVLVCALLAGILAKEVAFESADLNDQDIAELKRAFAVYETAKRGFWSTAWDLTKKYGPGVLRTAADALGK